MKNVYGTALYGRTITGAGMHVCTIKETGSWTDCLTNEGGTDRRVHVRKVKCLW